MKKFMLKIEDNMCKADEIAIIDRLEKEYLTCPDNYLYKYFTGRNIQWLRNKIKNDFFPTLPCDMEIKIMEQNTEIERLKTELKKMKDRLEDTECELTKSNQLVLQERLKNNHMKNKMLQNEEKNNIMRDKILKVATDIFDLAHKTLNE